MMTVCPRRILRYAGTPPIILNTLSSTKAKAMEGIYIGEVKNAIRKFFPLNLYRLTERAAVTPRRISMSVATIATFRLFPKPLKKFVLEVKIFAYHLSEKPLGGNTTSTVGLNDARIITNNGAMRNKSTRIVMILGKRLTLSSCMLLFSHALVDSGSGNVEHHQEEKNNEHQDITDSGCEPPVEVYIHLLEHHGAHHPEIRSAE